VGRVVKRPEGRVHVYMTVELFIEVWNMSPHRAEGELTASYDEGASVGDGGIAIGGGPSLRDPDILNRSALALAPGQSGSIHELSQEDDGRYYFPPKEVSLEGNEHKVLRMGAVKYRLDIGESATTPYVRELALNYETVEWPECRLLWNGELVDWARELERIDGFDVRERSRATANTLGSSYGVLGGYYNGNGDVRHGYYVLSSQNWSAFPANHSPNRRNVRYRIYQGNQATPWGRVLPSEWPDGGHNANFGKRTFKWLRDENPEPRPDDPDFWSSPPQPEPDRAPSRISNLGRFYSATELGNVYDPAMWSALPTSRDQIEDWARELNDEVVASDVLGGGNTLRVGRAEHELFSPTDDPEPGAEAARLLDLFHAGKPFSDEREEREGDLIRRAGHVNVNTAPRDVLRALFAGELVSDPLSCIALARHDTAERLSPREVPFTVGPPKRNGEEADALADAVIAGRPYVSVSEVANALFEDPVSASNLDGERVFGNLEFYPAGDRIQWNDQAAEECFGRIYNAGTVRSRNFRVHVIGQAVAQQGSEFKVISTRRKTFRVFSDPGERDADGAIDPEELQIQTIYEKNS
jgi:hypothetical protein